jgi:hypothetical protein
LAVTFAASSALPGIAEARRLRGGGARRHATRPAAGDADGGQAPRRTCRAAGAGADRCSDPRGGYGAPGRDPPASPPASVSPPS